MFAKKNKKIMKRTSRKNNPSYEQTRAKQECKVKLQKDNLKKNKKTTDKKIPDKQENNNAKEKK